MEETECQIFTLERINPDIGKTVLQVVKYCAGIIIVTILLAICSVINVLIPLFCLAVFMLLMLAFIIIWYSIKSIRIKETLELYNDRIVISGVNTTVINFDDIASYMVQDAKSLMLIIKLKDGQTKAIVNDLSYNLRPFVEAFREKIYKSISENNLSVTEETSFFNSGKFGLLLLFIVLGILFFFLTFISTHQPNR